MSFITSVGVSLPVYELHQKDIKSFIQHIFPRERREVERLLPVFEHASVEKRQFVVPMDWFDKDHTFQDRNDTYVEQALKHSLHAVDDCLKNDTFLQEQIPYEAIDMIIFVSSTGIATPTIDARMMNERPFRDDVKRVPLWGLGCAGGGAGMSRAMEYTKAYPDANVLVVCVELCSLTFQKDDHRKSNFIGAALFGDGISAALVLGEQSPYLTQKRKVVPKMQTASSKLKKEALDVMGWNINNDGFQVVFARSIPSLVESFWKDHVTTFLERNDLSPQNIPFFVAHPGGKKVLQAYEEVLQCSSDKFKHSYDVLKNHGNMSSATVLYVLKKWMEEEQEIGTTSVMAALGPGFSSELIRLEWSS
ncbi:type III polyketide synthase [Pontibacillus sp. HMF3514]|uniref:type III polyketide synthase n=1 Tax=Pontibacillus sp. HMF3514 TaxID=2692425 RepID=UPI00131F6507|nr:3-oxoacyl-[acyl-carrier-protein] synthase III C-terminal domain-containing protein [Pontibacillus sp. HMF3514]QHE52466.1 type III polyketide synthase [Pontibacillus sp. HMF3514]